MRVVPGLVATTLVLASTACGGGSPRPTEPASTGPTTPASFPPTTLATVAPHPLGPAATSTPAGYRRQVCRLHTGRGTLRFGYDVPAGYRSRRHGCGAAKHVHIDIDDGYNGQIGLTVTYVGERDRAAQVYGENFRFTAAGGEPDGDDSVDDLVYHRDVTVFGDATGSTVSFLCYCDGQSPVDYYAQGGGVLVTWSAFPQFRGSVTRQLARLIASGGAA